VVPLACSYSLPKKAFASSDRCGEGYPSWRHSLKTRSPSPEIRLPRVVLLMIFLGISFHNPEAAAHLHFPADVEFYLLRFADDVKGGLFLP
jgi:hypothetical protein